MLTGRSLRFINSSMINSAKANNQSGDLRPAPMVCLYGQGAARGYAIGRAVVMGAAALEVAHYKVHPDSLVAEQARLSRALETTRREMTELAETLPEDASRELAALLSVHGMLLSDPLLADEALIFLNNHKISAAFVVEDPFAGLQKPVGVIHIHDLLRLGLN